MESLVERVERLSREGVAVDIMTYVFRSEGLHDIQIRAAYDEVYARGKFDIVVERQIPRFVPKA